MSAGLPGGFVHVLRRGECLHSLGEVHGVPWTVIWDHPENRALREKSKDPGTVTPGEQVFIPLPRERWEECGANEVHTFALRGVPVKLRVRLLEGDAPLADEDCILWIEGRPRRCRLGSDGVLDEWVAPTARMARLEFSDGSSLALPLGSLPPATTVRGALARLNNLGYGPLPRSDIISLRSRRALKRFQAAVGLPASGRLDESTVQRLVSEHGS